MINTRVSTVVLTQDQIAFYHREGYLVLDAITTPEEVTWLRGIYDHLIETRAGRETGDQFDLAGLDEEGQQATLPQLLNPSTYAPELTEGLYRVTALAIARQLLGADATPSGEHAIFKPARTGAETPWHQDEAYWDPAKEYASLSIWIPLQDATVENGCMQFVPGSHRQQVMTHRSINDDPRIHGLEIAGTVAPAHAVACPIPAGGATVHHNRILHYTGPNTSDGPRRAYILGFGCPPIQRGEAREFPWKRQKQTARQHRAQAVSRTGASEPQTTRP